MDAEQMLSLSGAELETVPLFAGRGVPERARIETSSYVTCPQLGLNLVLDDDRVSAVHLHGGDAQYRRFDGELPFALTFGMSQMQVRARLGKPARSGEEQRVPFLGHMPPWDLFCQPNDGLHVHYSFGAHSIALVTLMTPNVARQMSREHTA